MQPIKTKEPESHAIEHSTATRPDYYRNKIRDEMAI